MTRTTRILTTIAAGLVLAVVLALVILPAAAVGGLVTTLAALGGMTVVGMILDDRSEFADATTLPTAGTGRALVGDVMDLGSVSGGIGANIDKPLYLVISVDTTVTSAGAATVAFEASSDAQAAIAVDGTATVHFRTAAFPKATLVAGYQVVIPIPPPPPNYERFLGVVQDVGTAALTAGKINAFLTMTPPVWTARPDAL